MTCDSATIRIYGFSPAQVAAYPGHLEAAGWAVLRAYIDPTYPGAVAFKVERGAGRHS